ncbi:MAG: HAD family hydrolase [Ruminococcus sp.]|nr:HAD family hydrolase [Ruminococcus sp.]
MTDLIFDYDGTIHNTMLTYAPAFRTAVKWLSDSGYIADRDYSDGEISQWLGFNSTDMWSQFQPQLDRDITERARIMLGEDMARRVECGEGALFEHAEEVLLQLRDCGYRLIFLSNCRIHYLERHRRVFSLDRFFDRFYCCEEFGFIPKSAIFRQIRPELSENIIAVGDRFHDIEMAAENSLPSVGCGYGYGSAEELSAADIIVKDITEIPDAVKVLSDKYFT